MERGRAARPRASAKSVPVEILERYGSGAVSQGRRAEPRGAEAVGGVYLNASPAPRSFTREHRSVTALADGFGTTEAMWHLEFAAFRDRHDGRHAQQFP